LEEKKTQITVEQRRERAVAVSYLSVHPFLGRRRVGCSHWEVDPLDVRLDPQYLLHEYCSDIYQAKRPKKKATVTGEQTQCIRQTELNKRRWLSSKRARCSSRSYILFPWKPVEPVTRTLLFLKYPAILLPSSSIFCVVVCALLCIGTKIGRELEQRVCVREETEIKEAGSEKMLCSGAPFM
jgi:hypothetical protein